MIKQIKGRLIEKSPTELVIDCNGIGYSVNISLNTFSNIGNDENVKLFTHLIVKEDSHTLFGFKTKSERSLFINFSFWCWSKYCKNNVVITNTY